MATRTIPSGQVGRSLPRLEARTKVTGTAEYAHNLRLPGMLHGKIFRSTVAHGWIKRIDVSAAVIRHGEEHHRVALHVAGIDEGLLVRLPYAVNDRRLPRIGRRAMIKLAA